MRHGETEWSHSGRHTGWTDIPLDAEGRRQAEALRPELEGWRFAVVFSSPLSRAVETCRLAGLVGAALFDDLREWNYGEYDGLTSAQIEKIRPGWSLWRDGCPGGEDARDVGDRADRVLGAVRAERGDVCLVAHGHLLRVLAARWLGSEPVDGRHYSLATGSLSVLGYEHIDPVLSSWNLTERGSFPPARHTV